MNLKKCLSISTITLLVMLVVFATIFAIRINHNISNKQALSGDLHLVFDSTHTNAFDWLEDTTLKPFPLDKLEWKVIIQPREFGFEGFSEKHGECIFQDDAASALRYEIEGCDSWRIKEHWLENANGTLINSKSQLRDMLRDNGVKLTNELAVSLVTITTRDLQLEPKTQHPYSAIASTEHGYLVAVVFKDTLGCSSKEPLTRIYLVTNDYETIHLATEKRKSFVESMAQVVKCVD